jgi:hypothetical protein
MEPIRIERFVRLVAGAFGIFLLLPCLAAAQLFEAPATVQANEDGAFSYQVKYTAAPGGEQLDYAGYYGISNTYINLAADWFCLFPPVNEVVMDIPCDGCGVGELIDPTQEGQVFAGIGTCGGGGGGAVTTILPYSPPELTAVSIDIRPGSNSNPIRPGGRGNLPVAILGSDVFDVTDVDVTTLAFGPDAATPLHDLTKSGAYEDHLRDVNEDGLTDLISHYWIQEMGISPDDADACITGETLDGTPFEGCDVIRAVSGGRRVRR